MNLVATSGRLPVKTRAAMWAIVPAILAIPLVAMQFSAEVDWSPADFAAAAVLLVGTGAILEVIARVVPRREHRLALGGIAVLATMLIWAQGAVGIV